MEAIIVFLVIGAILLALAIVGMDGIVSNNQAKIADAISVLQKRFGEGDYYTVLPGPRCVGIVWSSEVFILGDSIDDAVAIPLSDIRSADIELDGVNVITSKTTTTTNRGSQLAGGLVGGAILGPAGFLVGSLSGASTSKGKAVEVRKIKSVKLVIRVADRTKPVRTFAFCDFGFGEGYEADSPVVSSELERANHFHALLNGVIENRLIGSIASPEAT